tara:strand:+ start:12587 stop:13405 length:819 start_codon:yes stop_codon:yes gene_type:complete
MPKRRFEARNFETYRPEYGTNIVRDNRTGRLISPLRKEEVVSSRYRFSSKAKGIKLLSKIVQGTGANFLNFVHFSKSSVRRIGDKSILDKLRRKSDKILVRSDNASLTQSVSQRERLKQPRAAFPNTDVGRREALQFIKDLNSHYGVVIHHRDNRLGKVVGHGRVFVKGDSGSRWVYFAPEDSSTKTFARWKHELISSNTKGKSVKGRNGLSEKSLTACTNIAKKIRVAAERARFDDVVAASFVIYEKQINVPEFYDLLFIQGLRRPGFTPF